jgi:molybdopterin synthase sulfur carrier subunit
MSGAPTSLIRIELPTHLCRLASVPREIALAVAQPVTQNNILAALEAAYPMLRGTVREHGTLQRRPFLRFFACEQDLSHLAPDAELPAAIAEGREVFLIVGAIAGG